eukprot:gnl/MRDRNA2_/MRDRNA2_100155_c0_seq1.p1 gnl/MRDRNA2_/MRDRNA2_100155_c0~~gnl/MRDRNA2_/MRDRNA2_100155_c0_seq1.p1  ORF type:complete len:192 (-),score=46.47 gnl/MRDRNA2_/MRDRNA2_100155_c0_seq1:68-643(-)
MTRLCACLQSVAFLLVGLDFIGATPNVAVLAGLKQSDPQSYNVVAALLRKQSLGLLKFKQHVSSETLATAAELPVTEALTDDELDARIRSGKLSADAIPKGVLSRSQRLDWDNWHASRKASGAKKQSSLLSSHSKVKTAAQRLDAATSESNPFLDEYANILDDGPDAGSLKGVIKGLNPSWTKLPSPPESL